MRAQQWLCDASRQMRRPRQSMDPAADGPRRGAYVALWPEHTLRKGQRFRRCTHGLGIAKWSGSIFPGGRAFGLPPSRSKESVLISPIGAHHLTLRNTVAVLAHAVFGTALGAGGLCMGKAVSRNSG